MFLFLVNTVKWTPGLCTLLPVVLYSKRMSKVHAKYLLEIEDSINARLILNFFNLAFFIITSLTLTM